MSQDKFAPGKHLLLDFYGCQHLTKKEDIKAVLLLAANACNANVLNISLHSFGDNEGVTGVALLAESHISIHTWPESDYAAIDIFMCGKCQPELAIEPLRTFFKPQRFELGTHQRGLATEHAVDSVSRCKAPVTHQHNTKTNYNKTLEQASTQNSGVVGSDLECDK